MTLEVRAVRKAYGSVEVLHGVDLIGNGGDVVAVVGANGAGKSTLIKILSGAESLDSGELWLDGQRLALRTPHDAQAAGIRTVYQELTLIPGLSVTENLLLGRMPRRAGLIDWTEAHRRARTLLDEAGFSGIDPATLAGDLTVARQQMVEIAKALASEPRVLVLDEPSAVLAGRDLDALFALIRRLQERGVLIIYVSHRLAEVTELATSIVVIRDGTVVKTTEPARTSENELITLMAGRKLERIYPDARPEPGGELLTVRGLSRPGEFENVSFTLHAGEIVGMFGLVGAGRSELARCLFGDTRVASGTVSLDGTPVRFDHPAAAISAGLALVTEDRKRTGMVASMSVRDNIALATLHARKRGPLIDRRRQKATVNEMIAKFDIRPDDCAALPIATLSGGNQQKSILAKWLLAGPRVLILDEPTRGVDMATRVDIYRTIDALARSGHAVLLISSDLAEVIGATDRVLVMRNGQISGEIRSDTATEDQVLGYSIREAA
ncbi:sugar ABC transporter ATP-binding protein [Dactylosporangium fulvum]|uniref:Sugar ABC transporter ATP-binding protein n=1 Tax=Dactylosporangium fulvum TaxID=53359 RepID=A0ABY5VRC5_9ACTN|nr:sugar ABC transporter ATP-binding protein [Dactylosporangium fulvum]UWP80332.1 sugar ABC transporter ATP-binding protein [Dactylosporangium fulvum]